MHQPTHNNTRLNTTVKKKKTKIKEREKKKRNRKASEREKGGGRQFSSSTWSFLICARRHQFRPITHNTFPCLFPPREAHQQRSASPPSGSSSLCRPEAKHESVIFGRFCFDVLDEPELAAPRDPGGAALDAPRRREKGRRGRRARRGED